MPALSIVSQHRLCTGDLILSLAGTSQHILIERGWASVITGTEAAERIAQDELLRDADAQPAPGRHLSAAKTRIDLPSGRTPDRAYAAVHDARVAAV